MTMTKYVSLLKSSTKQCREQQVACLQPGFKNVFRKRWKTYLQENPLPSLAHLRAQNSVGGSYLLTFDAGYSEMTQLEYHRSQHPGQHSISKAKCFTCSWTSSFLPCKRRQKLSEATGLFPHEHFSNPYYFIAIIIKWI